MIDKSKLFLVSSVADEAISMYVPLYDITIFRDVVALEEHVDKVPSVISTIVFTSKEMPFTGDGMQRLRKLLDSSFLTIKDEIIYIIEPTQDKGIVESYFASINLDKIFVYQGELTQKYLIDVITGRVRKADEHVISEVTYRMRTEEYRKQKVLDSYDSVDSMYVTDEEQLKGIPDEEEAVAVLSEFPNDCELINVCGLDSDARALFASLTAQYKATTAKTLVIDRDVEYHRLNEFISKSGVDYCFIDVKELYSDIAKALRKIRTTDNKLIVIGAIERTQYDYNFLVELLYNNLTSDIAFMVVEHSLNELPRGVSYVMVMENNIVSILKTCEAIESYIDPAKVYFVGTELSELGYANITSTEMREVLEEVLELPYLNVQVVKVNGLSLTTSGFGYDLMAIFSSSRGF